MSQDNNDDVSQVSDNHLNQDGDCDITSQDVRSCD